MNHIFSNKRIAAILSVLPKKVVNYEDELEDYNFPVKQSKLLGKMMDYHTRRQCEPTDGVADYALFGMQYLLHKHVIETNAIEAVVVVTSSQDYIMPTISYLLQGNLALSQNVFCCDISQACGGYIYGLIQSFMLMDTYGFHNVVLITGEMLTKKIGKRDRNARPIIGDAVTISIIKQCENNGPIYTTFENHGEMADAIKIPAGGLKMPSSPETAIETLDETNNYRALDHFYMDGERVFNFVMKQVPPLVENIMKQSGDTIESINYFMFHQPNKYMVDRLADELEIPAEKIPSNIVGIYGNASTATIPLNICHNIANESLQRKLRLCFSGFGGGLTCNALIMNNPKMDFCEIVDFEKNGNNL